MGRVYKRLRTGLVGTSMPGIVKGLPLEYSTEYVKVYTGRKPSGLYVSFNAPEYSSKTTAIPHALAEFAVYDRADNK